jgi:hypothetical protein
MGFSAGGRVQLLMSFTPTIALFNSFNPSSSERLKAPGHPTNPWT